uniref:Uncharacterized protein n=1 Tax=Anguilla anguilla TaxID=7936 RepID=A0A0E9S0N7_ANGAN
MVQGKYLNCCCCINGFHGRKIYNFENVHFSFQFQSNQLSI